MRYAAYIEPGKCKVFFEADNDTQAQDRATTELIKAIVLDAFDLIVTSDEKVACSGCGLLFYRTRLYDFGSVEGLFCLNCCTEKFEPDLF